MPDNIAFGMLLKNRESNIQPQRNLSYYSGAAGGARTPDPVITNDVLYQLSYCGAVAECLASRKTQG